MAGRDTQSIMSQNPSTNNASDDLSDTEIELLKEIFENEFSSDSHSLDVLFSKLDASRNFKETLEAAAAVLDGDDAKARLDFFTTLYHLADGDLALVHLITSNKTISTTRDLALNYCALGLGKLSPSTEVDPAHLTQFRTRLFASDPTAVIYGGLVGSDILPLNAELKSGALGLLKVALSRNFNIAKESVRGLLGDSSLMETVPAEYRQGVSDFIATLQRLQALVSDPDDIAGLILCSFTSANSIARTPKTPFVSTVVQKGKLSAESATRIWNQASVVSVRNEEIWTSYLRARNEMPVAAVGASGLQAKAQTLTSSSDEGIINFSTLFKDTLQTTECADCSSVTSPAAYYVELLQILKKWPTNPADTTSPSLLDKLFLRRPDLGDLQLSCANTNILIPYIDLVNEALESVATNASAVITHPYNMDETDTSDDCLAEPQHVSFDVYRNVIQPLVFPMALFPYNQAIDSVRAYLVALGSSRYKLLTALRSEQRLVVSGSGSGGDTAKRLAEAAIVLDRAAAAESLGLLHEEYVAITHEAFQTAEFLGAKDAADYRVKIGLKAASAYWGYATDAAMISTDEKGLSFVKDQFLPRASISFQELLDLLKTRYVGKRLVIETADGSPKFTGQLGEMRLRQLADETGTAGPLTVQICDDIQAFVRLRRKLGWSIIDTDAAVVMLAGTKTTGVNPEVIDGLAYIKQMADLTGMPVSNLLPLWGAIDTRRETSLYARLFLQRRLMREDPVFAADENGEYLAKPGIKFADHKQVVLSSLRLTAPAFDAIAAATKIGEDLTLESISLVYRVALLCQILEITPLKYAGFLSLYPDNFNPYETPRKTLKVVEKFSTLKRTKWSLELLLFVVKGVLDPENPQSYSPQEDVVPATVAIIASNLSVNPSPPLDARGSRIQDATRHEVSAVSHALFGAKYGAAIEGFVEGSGVVTTKVILQKEIDIPEALRAKVQLRKSSDGASWVLTLTGLLTAEEEHMLIETVPSDASWEASVRALEKESMSVYENLLSPALAKIETSNVSLIEGQAAPNITSPDHLAVWQEKTIAQRRNSYLTGVSSSLQKKLAQQAVLQILKPSFSDIDAEVIQLLLSDILTIGSGVSGMDALCGLSPPDIDGESNSFDGYFLPPTTDVYSFTSALPDKPRLSIDGVAIEFTKDAGGPEWRSTIGKRLVNGQSYSLHFTGKKLSTSIQWATSLGQPSPFTPQMLIDTASVSIATSVFTKLSKVAHVIRIYGLRLEEVHYFQENSPAFDFNNITFTDLQTLRMYAEMRDSFPAPKDSPFPLLNQYKWLAQPDTPENLAAQLSLASGWPEHQVVDLLSAKYPSVLANDLVAIFRDMASLYEMWDSMRTIGSLTIPSASPEMLYALAEPVPPMSTSRNFQDAAKLRLAMHSREVQQVLSSVLAANNRLRENQRSALISYLLQQDYIRGLGLYDADSLFEHFLIDVQMGPVLQTSRLKQAISVIQLFVQRCILGLEKGNGIPSTSINRENWDYMLRYRLWEANRKAFLYAESWIDPTLRDDKSEQFKELESVVLQTKLTSESISDAVKTYIYAANEVADLEVHTYLWERRDLKGDHGSFHFWARTRTAPYRYYYRKMDLKGPKADQVVYWKPWTSMEVDIQPHDVDADGNKLPKAGTYLVPALFRGRLFLFIPQIVLKTDKKADENANTNSPTFEELAKEKTSAPEVEKHWEIKMGWTEYRNGKWSAKQISQSALEVKAVEGTYPPAGSAPPRDLWNLATQFPDITSFKFWVRERTFKLAATPDPIHILVVDVERSIGTTVSNSVSYPLGQFELRGQQLVLASPDPNTPWKSTVPTSFMKLTWNVAASQKDTVPKTVIEHGKNKKRPLLTVTEPPKLSSEYTWTMAFDELNFNMATGFILDIATAHDVQTFFAFPPVFREGSDPEYDEALELATFPNVVSPLLVEAATLTEGLKQVYGTVSNLSSELYFDGFGGRNSKIFHEQANPSALYTWETSVHVVSLLMERLLSTQQYDLALSIARCAFDPTIDGNSVNRCWLFPPFRDPAVQAGNPLDFGSSWENKLAADEWNANRASVHAAARGRPVAYMKRLAMKYIEIIIASGDEFFRQNTLETIPLAIQRYVEASHIFGPAPMQTPSLGRRTVKTYNQLAKLLDSFSNATVDLELDFPFHSKPATRGSAATKSASPMPFIETGYFCIPTNPQIADLRGLIDDRLYKIRNCMDINGKEQKLPLFEPPIDPGMLVRAGASGISPSAIASDIDSPMPNYRFLYLLGKAFELCSELKSMDALVLAAKEKKDAEALSALTAKHSTAVQTLVMDMKQTQKQEALKAIDTLQETRRMHESRLAFYLALTGEKSKQIPTPDSDWEDIQQTIEMPSTDDLRMNSNEKLDMDKGEAAMALGFVASTLDNIAAGLLVFPSLTVNVQPFGVGMSTELGVGIIARAMQATAGGYKQAAQLELDRGVLASKKAQMIRQLQERRQQANQAGRDIKVVDRMIEAQYARVAVCDSEILVQKKEIDNAAEIEVWLRDKYSNKELYAWMENKYSNLFHQTYLLANELATKAEKAYRFERATEDVTFLRQGGGGYWDSGRGGMLCAENMYIDLKKMEAAYLGKQAHDFEVVKTVSLRQINPWALLSLREKGTANFNLPEVLFDIDFPGHYCRRIRSVAITIPCIVGPYTSLNCTLNLLSHKYRISKQSTSDYTENPDGDLRFRTDNIPISSIAVSGGQQDSGVFELDFHDERYLPFEGAGAISEWRIDLPTALKQFDYHTINDVIMHLRYTTSDGGATLKSKANEATLNFLKTTKGGSSATIIDLTNDYSSEWYSFAAKLAKGGETATIALKGVSNMLPFWARQMKVMVEKISILVSPPPKLDMATALTLTGYEGVKWEVSGTTLENYLILVGNDIQKPLVADWKLSVANDNAAGETIERMWLVIEYTVG